MTIPSLTQSVNRTQFCHTTPQGLRSQPSSGSWCRAGRLREINDTGSNCCLQMSLSSSWSVESERSRESHGTNKSSFYTLCYTGVWSSHAGRITRRLTLRPLASPSSSRLATLYSYERTSSSNGALLVAVYARRAGKYWHGVRYQQLAARLSS